MFSCCLRASRDSRARSPCRERLLRCCRRWLTPQYRRLTPQPRRLWPFPRRSHEVSTHETRTEKDLEVIDLSPQTWESGHHATNIDQSRLEWENEPPETMEETSPELMLPRERRQEERGQLLGKFGRFPCRPQALSVTRCERNIRVVDGNRRGLTQVKIEISCFRGAWLERCTADTFPIAVSTILSAVVCRIDVNIVGSAPRSGPAATAWPALPPAHSASEMFEGKTAGPHVRLGSVPAPAPSSPGTERSPEEVAPAQAAQEAEAPLPQCGPKEGQEASLPSLETASGVFLLTFLIVYIFYGYFYFLV
ncbi:uncharacterized protein [Dasypus novemcinctus]|uniref:uncharacterized protein isoform X1 n=1 Tax=Dasypus novemcinctus TaxID=9361 RepID=UPI00265FE9B8|nr:uncharacterized protein LOC131275767 [Dasypus novemcinctus]